MIDSTSDHCALLITDKITPNQPRKRRFHFEAMWTKKEECKEIIKVAWEGCLNQNTPEGVVASLQNVATDLVRWNASIFGYIPKQIQNKQKELNALVLQDRNGVMGKEINRLRSEINDLLDREEIL